MLYSDEPTVLVLTEAAFLLVTATMVEGMIQYVMGPSSTQL